MTFSPRAEGARAEGARAEGAMAESRRAEYARTKIAPRAKPESKTLITEGGVKQRVSAYRKEKRQQMGWGLGKIPKWERRATT